MTISANQLFKPKHYSQTLTEDAPQGRTIRFKLESASSIGQAQRATQAGGSSVTVTLHDLKCLPHELVEQLQQAARGVSVEIKER